MENKIIITIGREFGSGGREIGQKLATELGIAYYDKELINLASKESGICGEFFEKADEKTSGSLFQAFAMGLSMNSAVFQNNDFLSNDSLFQIQSDVIRKVARESSCVIVGRCADYILREDKNCFNIFIHCPHEDRIKRVCQMHNFSEQQAEDLIVKTDKTRASYYNYYTDKSWGAAASYHLTVDSSFLGIDKTVQYIKAFSAK